MNTKSLLVDNLAFAKRAERVSGRLFLTDLPRLAELLSRYLSLKGGVCFQPKADVRYVLVGEVDAVGHSLLHLLLDADLTTACQRCLESVDVKLHLSFDYLICNVNEVDEELENGDDYDLQDISQSMNLIELIEDELIMAMPIAPAHEYDCADAPTQSGERLNPFAVLKGFVKSEKSLN